MSSEAQVADREDQDLVANCPVFKFAVYVRIKKTSKYFHQGLLDPADRKSFRLFFKLEGFAPSDLFTRDGYTLKLNSNSYRPEDCEFFLGDPDTTTHLGGKRMVRIA